MALDHLLEALDREARATAERLRAEARTEAERITALATTLADHQRDAEVERITRARRAQAEVAVAAARHETRRQVLEARARLLARIELAVRTACPPALVGASYRASLPARLAEALGAFAPGVPVSVRCAAALADPLLEAWPPPWKGEVRPDESVGSGFVLSDLDGRLEVEDTLEGRLDARRVDLEREALRRLGLES